jgi:hypothetical protein
MPKANWGISEGVIDDFDRDSQYTPYAGPIPPNGVYEFLIKVLKYIPGTRDKNPQLRVGLELSPRTDRREERQYAKYFIMGFLPVTDKTAFRYVPFLDALGVSEREFRQRTITDEDGNIKKIGNWRNDGKEIIQAQIADGTDEKGNSRKEVVWFGAIDSEEYDDEEEEYEDEEIEEEEPF